MSVLIELKFQITDNKIECIQIYEEDDIEEVVNKFCVEKKFKQKVKDFIMTEIDKNMDENIQALEESCISSRILDDLNNNLKEKSISISLSEVKPHNKVNELKKSKSKQKVALYSEQNPTSLNAGERLYNNYKKNLKKKEVEMELNEKERIKQELKDATFCPSINTTKIKIKNDLDVSVEQRLLNHGKELENRKKQEQELKHKKDTDFSYKPIINDKSRELANKIKTKRKNMLTEGNKSDTETEINRSQEVLETESSYCRKKVPNQKLKKNTRYNANVLNLEQKVYENDKSGISKISSKNYYDHHDSNEELSVDPPISEIPNKYLRSHSSLIVSKTKRVQMKKKELEDINPSEPVDFKSILRPPKIETFGKPLFKVNVSNHKTRNNYKTILSKSIDNESNTFTTIKDIHSELYVNGIYIKKKKLKEIEDYRNEHYPFKPRIAKSPDVVAYRRKEAPEQFIDRLVKSKQVSNENFKKKLYEIKKAKEEIISKSKSKSKSREKRPEVIHPNLDGFYDERLITSKIKIQEEKEIFEAEAKEIWINESLKKILKIKITFLKEIFDQMDSDGDGKISSKKIKISGLKENITLKLSPFFEELNKNKIEVDFKEFFTLVNNLFD